MDRITFSVNGQKCSVGSEISSDVSLNNYVRGVLDLQGTKYMCKEGGCGACIVAVTKLDQNGHKRTFSVNSCLVSITSCQDWEIKTIEGLGDRRTGYHAVQRALAEYNGTQCGYCSPGWVMSMYSLLESENYNLTQLQIENSFGSNTCRCTGFRPILSAFKSFAKDAPKPKLEDIEDLKLCKMKECEKNCDKTWCIVNKNDSDVSVKRIDLKDDRLFYRVKLVSDIFSILEKEGYESYMLVGGNTGRGAVPIFTFPRVLIDVSAIQEIKGHYIDQNLIIGAGNTLTELLDICLNVPQTRKEFHYLEKFYEHIQLVAHIPVRNIGTIAGNLMTKHRNPNFPSDIFLLLTSVGACLTLVKHNYVNEVEMEDFLGLNMTGYVITHIKLPPLSENHRFTSLKIMPRAQNAHAQVNAAFLYNLDPSDHETVQSARIVITGLSGKFVRATLTEHYLVHKRLFTNEVLQGALHVLNREIVAEFVPGDMEPAYRKKCALGLFYKGLLQIISESKIKPIYRSGRRDFRRTRPLSHGTEVYDTNPVIWPITEPMPKKDALAQTSGEALYVNDIPIRRNELFCAFVTADIGLGEIESIDPTPALKQPGVIAFFSAQDIPGKNSYLPQKAPSQYFSAELFASKTINYYDQAIGMIVAESEYLAQRAALVVRVKYKVSKNKPILTIRQARKEDLSRITLIFVLPSRERGVDIQRVIKGETNIFPQYHFTMETISSVVRPNDDGLEVFVTAQWIDLVHIAISECLNIEQSRINLTTPRCGGAYGVKISRGSFVACACSLASYLLNKPCRMVLSIQQSMRIIGKRLGSSLDFEVGINDSGEIQYLEYHVFEDIGYTLTDPIPILTLPAIKNCYNNRRWQYKIFAVRTDTAANTYCRAPGELEAIAHTEHIMERISYEIDKDPVEVRLKNIEITETIMLEVIHTLLKDGDYHKRKEEINVFNQTNRWKKRGLRVSLCNWPASTFIDYSVLFTIFHGDGTIVISHGAIEIGQGINTKVMQVVAYTLNIPIDKIKVKATTAEKNPNSYIDGTSRSTISVCFGAIKCCQIILDRFQVVRNTLNNPTWEELVEVAFNRGINLQASYRVTGNDQDTYRSQAAALTEVELDILTGEHEVLRVDIFEDVGTSVNPELDVGQIEGAFVMGLGYWTHERLDYNKTGELLTDRTWYYDVPLAKDIPIDFRVKLRRNSFNPLGTLGAKAVGEPPICLAVGVAFALREAITASREDSGYPRKKWFNVDGPYTLAQNVLSADVKLEEFLFY